MEVCRFMVSVGCLAFLVTLTAANLPPGLRVRRRRHFGSCGEQEYPNGNICCLNCKAGTFVKSPCTTAGQRGTCEECDYGTFTEHDNHLQKCVDCAKCGPDQEVAEQCTNTQNTKCRCKAGRFCNPEEACEVCRKCLTCKSDEEIVRNCTFTSNTVCKKIPLKPGSSLDAVFFVLCVIPVVLFLVAGGIFLKYKKKCGCRGSSQASPTVAKSEENCSGRGSSAALILLSEEEQLPTLVPVNGEQSLRSCFELFEELDVDFHKKFFRRLDFSDNAIKSKDNLLYEDKIHELLNSWVEREGKKANLNELLKVLVDLNQKRTAEKIMKKVLDNGQYCTESKDEV
uniref:Hematopoietic death receptor n=1 Tax=Oryzias latipes TaxID=8090 RepID=A0A3P9MKI1_ORYLA